MPKLSNRHKFFLSIYFEDLSHWLRKLKEFHLYNNLESLRYRKFEFHPRKFQFFDFLKIFNILFLAQYFSQKFQKLKKFSLVASESAKCNFDYFYMVQGTAYCIWFHMAGKGCHHTLRNWSNIDRQSHNRGYYHSYGILEEALK